MKKKTRVKAKTKPASAVSVSPDQDIVALLTTLAQKLTSFEAKLDTMLRRIAPQASVPAAPRPQPVLVSSPEARRDHRPLHKAVCADCHKECEVPFKPSGERPVYCKECFRTRRTNGTLKPQGGGKPVAPAPAAVQVKAPDVPKTVPPARPAARQKTVKPAKPATKKPVGKARKK